MAKRLIVRFLLGTAITAVVLLTAFILHLVLAGAIDSIPENRDKVAPLPGEQNSWISVMAILGGWALLTYCCWSDIGVGRWKRAAYVALFLAVLSISFLNFAHADMLINRSGQLILNVVMIFLSLVLTIEISRSSPETADGIALRLMSIFFLVVGGIAVPGFFSLLWCADRAGIAPELFNKMGDGWVAGVSAILATLTAGWSQKQLSTRRRQPRGIEK